MSSEQEKDRLECRKRRARQGKPVRARYANPTAASAYGQKAKAWKVGWQAAEVRRDEFYGTQGMSPEERAEEDRLRRLARKRCRAAWETEWKLSRQRIGVEKELMAAAEDALAEIEELVDVGSVIAGIAAGTVPATKMQLEAAKALQRGTVAALREVLARFDEAKVRLTSYLSAECRMYGDEEEA